MSALSFRNIDRLFAAVENALPPQPRRTGQPGLFRVLREGEAEVTIWPAQGADEHGAECEHWTGPILADSDTHITLDIGAEPMTWMKSERITVKYGDVPAYTNGAVRHDK